MKDAEPTWRALIVDDEVHGRDVVRHLLQPHSDIRIVGEAAHGLAAREAIRTLRPDIVFLDIEMPKLGGMELIEALDPASRPVIVLITAHEDYAVQAFERCAFDYLLKPFDRDRFDRMLARVRASLRTTREADFGRRVRHVFHAAQALEPADSAADPSRPIAEAEAHLTRFAIKNDGRILFVSASAVDWLEASDNYVALHVGEKTHLLHESLGQLERTLNPKQFLRIHRSTIVQIDRVKELQPFTNSEYIVVLRDGTRLKLSRTYRARADEVLGLR